MGGGGEEKKSGVHFSADVPFVLRCTTGTPQAAPDKRVARTSPCTAETPKHHDYNSVEEILKQYDKKYTYEQLLRGEYPASINTAKKEVWYCCLLF